MDNRIGPKFLHAGPGYGGSCFPKDTLALLKTAEDHGSPMRIVEAVVKVNDSRKRAMGRKVIDALGGAEAARGKKAALLGLTFKPNTDDMRESPALAIAQTLLDAGVAVAAYDPQGMEQARALLPDVTMCKSAYDAIEGADVVVIVTEWDAFRALDLKRVKQLAKAPVMVDLRNIYKPEDMRAAGFTYISVGRA
jgi:UDPglucose 6-dehydrogenase